MVKHIVTVDGRVFRRTSQRTYSHALVIRYDEEAARKAAYERGVLPSDHDAYAWYSFVAQQAPDRDAFHPGYKQPFRFDAARIEWAQAMLIGGFDAYVADRRAEAIDRFETARRCGVYRRHVASWHMTEAAARKACVRYAHKDRIVEAFVIPVGEVI